MLTEHTRDIIAFHDGECRITFVSPAVLRILGYFPEELSGRRTIEFVHPADVARATAAIQRCRTVGGNAELTIRLCARDGRHVWVEALLQAIFDDDGNFVHTMSSSRDVTERKRAHDAVQRELTTVYGVTEGTSDAIFARRVDGTYEFVNRAAEDLLGRATGLFTDRDENADQDVVAQLLGFDDPAVLAATHTIQLERQLSLDGAARTFAVRLTPRRNLDGVVTGIIAIASDVTDLVRADVTRRHREKMDAVEQLAGGIAHEFNNLLTVISGYGDLLEQGLTGDDVNLELLAELRSAARRAGTLTQRLLSFSRKQITRLGALDLNATLGAMQPFLRSMIGESVALELVLGDNVPPVVADQSQVEQAIINLAINAREAISDAGTARIVTTFVPDGRGGRDAPFGEVCIRVSDTGRGIDPALHDRIFEPFYTTKSPGKGMGLGLSTVREIVERAGGTIRVESAPGKGSTFTISLPCADLQLEPGGRAAQRRREAASGDSVLIVDDEDSARQSA